MAAYNSNSRMQAEYKLDYSGAIDPKEKKIQPKQISISADIGSSYNRGVSMRHVY